MQRLSSWTYLVTICFLISVSSTVSANAFTTPYKSVATNRPTTKTTTTRRRSIGNISSGSDDFIHSEEGGDDNEIDDDDFYQAGDGS